jgi:carbon-monoxide dehydrogenase large subunit/6-hydroxypseudooxynicotine dehydrogenase subunit gamma
VRISVDEQGTVEVVSGSASVGQGMETVLAQICADALGVDFIGSVSSTAKPIASSAA